MAKPRAFVSAADLARAVKVAKAAGDFAVELYPDGVLRIVPYDMEAAARAAAKRPPACLSSELAEFLDGPLAKRREPVL
ncbi:hypothetical protein [Methylocystis iwaonis]|uniref:hypothetical protein n=1 Tax=Methylocystis iwaonis TaxID=2885079 RepID=UPI002E7BBD38|nr:hypothetical protein [Methylocystis iwaonis]